jgi:hypothetical protein
MKLSDAFSEVDRSNLLALTVRVYNINWGHNTHILQKSKFLSDYAAFIGRVKENKATGRPLNEAIEEAIRYCIDSGIMKEYLETHSSEVRNMLFTEFNMDAALRIRFEEGREDGIEKASESIAVRMLRNGSEPEFASKCTGLSIEKILLLSDSIKQN